jgi:cytochrome c2
MKLSQTLVSLTIAAAVGMGGVHAAKPKPKPKPPAKAKGDVKNGQKLFTKKFPNECQGCHKFKETGNAGIGGDLTHVGKKHKADKIKGWLKDPKKQNPKTIMPPVKGTDKELTDIAAFLATQK